jgi:lipopolysaccharide biosynthesis protein
MYSSAIFRDYWAALKPLSVKEENISEYETKLSRYFVSMGFKMPVAFSLSLFVPFWNKLIN